MERDFGVDWLKSFAIVLVVLGHAIQFSQVKSFDANILFHLIYSFHMPLFMFVSGYLIKGDKTIGFLWKQFRMLVVPFLVWMILYSFYFRRLDLQHGNWAILPYYYLQVLRFPGKGLWFLWVLYLIDVAYYLLRKSRYFYLFSFLLVVFLYVLILLFPFFNYYGLGLFRIYYPYFLLGCLMRKYRFDRLIGGWTVMALLFLSVLFEMAWSRVGATYVFGLPIAHDTGSLYSILIRIFTPVPILFLLFCASRYFIKGNKIIVWLSTNTLAVYASHFIWIYWLTAIFVPLFPVGSPMVICLVFAVTALLTWFSVSAINRVRWLRMLLFGR